MDEQFDERNSRAVELRLFKLLRRHFADNVVERGFGNAVEVAAEKYLAGADGFQRGSSPWIKSVTAFASALCAARAPGFSACCFSSASISSFDRNVKNFR